MGRGALPRPADNPGRTPPAPARSRLRAHPARRGSDLATSCACHTDTGGSSPAASGRGGALHRACPRAPPRHRESQEGRSEEHTSELQSRLHLVCRLLLEKKKNIPNIAASTS